VNGQVMQNSHTGEMIFNVAYLIIMLAGIHAGAGDVC
jgi:2-keto-4-pentenoate hydratase/2-oxohepta-3-ene-1,7-dioic acid hydratase in catechol pathway